METLIKELEAYKKSLSAAERIQLSDSVLDRLYAVYPFNKFEYTISHLIAKGVAWSSRIFSSQPKEYANLLRRMANP